jgi:hypothetical protein
MIVRGTRKGTCCASSQRPNISLVTSTAANLAIWLAFLFPAAQVLRMIDQVAAAIDPRVSVVGSLHELLVSIPGVLRG